MTVEKTSEIVSILKSTALSSDQFLELQCLLEDYQDIFSDAPGKTNLLQCRLELNTTQPVNTQQYHLPFAMKDAVEK